MSHTQGKLSHKRLGVILGGPVEKFANGSGQKQIAMVCGIDDNSEIEANARRLVAAWNACEGITTERLEDLGRPLMAHLIGCDERAERQVKEADSLRAVNAELLDALEVAKGHIGMASLEVSHCKDAAQIRAAIASARKQGEQG